MDDDHANVPEGSSSTPLPAALHTPAPQVLTPTALPSPTPVSEEVVRSCVTPRKLKGVQEALEKESRRHRCAVNLLPFFFTTAELSSSNTEGSHNKNSLDSTKLNSIKVLVFSKFPAESSEEKEKAWKFIKGKINARCRASKFAFARGI